MNKEESVKLMTDKMAKFVGHIGKKLPDDVIAKLEELAAQETAPLPKVLYETMTKNQGLAVSLDRPSCQDTGVLQFWVKCGTNFPLINELEGLLKEAVVQATFATPLRHNSVETFDEYNTKRNVGKGTPTVFWDIVPNDDHCEIYSYMAGGGCTLPGKAMVLMPGAGYEVRGNGEMFPLNGPCWSLFFEYLGNILYALFIHRLSNKALAVLTILLGVALASFAIFDISGYGNMGVGWTLDGINFGGGLLRMLFPFSMGMLLSRNFKPIKVKGAFWICAIALVTLFSVPYLEGATPVCTNGIYEAFCVIIAFPVLVWLGASGTTTDKKSTQICKFLGDISYPVYVIHYPFMYLFYAWLIKNQLFTLEQTWQVALCVYAWNILLAYLCLKFYDEPVRKYLARRFLSKKR